MIIGDVKNLSRRITTRTEQVSGSRRAVGRPSAQPDTSITHCQCGIQESICIVVAGLALLMQSEKQEPVSLDW
jgi:hypothetical protein